MLDEQRKFKADTRNVIDIALLSICITLFGLVSTLKPEMIATNPLFILQLVLAVPLFMCGLLVRIKEVAYSDSLRWTKLGAGTFLLAYGFFINSIGLLLAFTTATYISMVFFAVNTLLTLIRAGIVVSYNSSKLRSRIFREIVQFAIVLFLGILPALGIY
jgi:hypothetical protein